MNYVIIDQLALTLVDIFLCNMLQIPCKSLLCFEKLRRLTDLKPPKIWLVKFFMFNFKIVYLIQLLTDLKI